MAMLKVTIEDHSNPSQSRSDGIESDYAPADLLADFVSLVASGVIGGKLDTGAVCMAVKAVHPDAFADSPQD